MNKEPRKWNGPFKSGLFLMTIEKSSYFVDCLLCCIEVLLVWCFYCLRLWCHVQEVIGSGLVHWGDPEESGGEGGGRGDRQKKKKSLAKLI